MCINWSPNIICRYSILKRKYIKSTEFFKYSCGIVSYKASICFIFYYLFYNKYLYTLLCAGTCWTDISMAVHICSSVSLEVCICSEYMCTVIEVCGLLFPNVHQLTVIQVELHLPLCCWIPQCLLLHIEFLTILSSFYSIFCTCILNCFKVLYSACSLSFCLFLYFNGIIFVKVRSSAVSTIIVLPLQVLPFPTKHSWTPQKNGRAIKLVSIEMKLLHWEQQSQQPHPSQ